ncbi:MAG: class I SAM-dependent methyltransferase [Cyanobacteria bacterium P01_E01_bin.42]
MSNHPTSRDREVQRFSRRNIFRAELIYGVGFNSPGGTAAIDMLCKDVPKFPGMSILDVGCGSGGATFHFAREYEAEVVGVDYTLEMIALCQERHQEQPHLPIAFQQGDIQILPLTENSFDLA